MLQIAAYRLYEAGPNIFYSNSMCFATDPDRIHSYEKEFDCLEKIGRTEKESSICEFEKADDFDLERILETVHKALKKLSFGS